RVNCVVRGILLAAACGCYRIGRCRYALLRCTSRAPLRVAANRGIDLPLESRTATAYTNLHAFLLRFFSPIPRSLSMSRRLTRRQALGASAASLGYMYTAPAFAAEKIAGANGKLYFAGIGVGGKGSSDIENAADCAQMFGGEVVAICDIDESRLNSKANQDGIYYNRGKPTKYAGMRLFAKAQKFSDYRKIFDDAGLLKSIDAFTVSTPDHNHAQASLLAIRNKKHVYCQKPLTHDVYEAFLMRHEAKKYGVCTQMGNQGTAANGLRKAVEMVQAGEIGQVREVHVWTNRPIWPQAPGVTDKKPPKEAKAPKNVNWDAFLGPAP